MRSLFSVLSVASAVIQLPHNFYAFVCFESGLHKGL